MSTAPMLLDFAMTPAGVSRQTPCAMWSWKMAPPRTMAPGTISLVEVLTARSSSAAATVITFAVDPGS
jgi:hypothetical protein